MELLIKNCLVLPMTEQPGRPKYYRGAVAVSGDRIALVSDSPQRIERYERERGEGLQVADGAGRLVMPGLINLHNHVSMTLMRGYADDLPLMPWLTEKIWPFEAKLDGDDIYSGAELGIAEMLLGGTTAFVDMYWYADRVAEAALACGMRAGLCRGIVGGADGAEKLAENLKLGFLVKQPEEPWFQTEWKFADKAGKDLGFEVIKIAVPDGEKTLNAIDSLAASGAKGFVICTPDPKLGSAIVAKARGYDMKVIAVDDQFVNAKGKPMDTVPLVMMAATKIGERQGQELYKEMQKRGWDVKESAVMAITANELDTARRRTTGSMDALKAAGFPEKQIYQVPTKSNDIPGAFDAANSMLVQHPEVKHWLIVGMNDSTVLGGVRATEGQGFKAADIIGIGINGVDAVSELSKAQATGFYGSLLPSPDVHGYKSSEMLYNWVAKDVEPPKFTEVTDVVLITRDNFKEELEKKGLGGK